MLIFQSFKYILLEIRYEDAILFGNYMAFSRMRWIVYDAGC